MSADVMPVCRFPQFGSGMLRMRPNMADLYLTLAPSTRSAYQKTVADALFLLVPVSVLNTLAFTLIGIVLTHAAEPARMLLTATVVSTAASLVGLATHLIGPEGAMPRKLVNIVVVLGASACYWGGFWLLGALGLPAGTALLALVTLSFGGAVWFAAQREYQARTPRFDAPLA